MGGFGSQLLATSLRLAVAAAVCGAGVTAAAAAAAAEPGDPPGANGTVKIDGQAFDDGIDNEPHVTCDFRVNFFNFDNDERANIVFTVQPPTGPGTELLRRDNVLVSDDPAGGGRPDPDESFVFSASDLGLGAYTPQPQQGYHIKLTVERIGAPGAGKHKVFWVGPCAGTPAPSATPTTTPGGGGPGGGGPGGGGPGGGGGGAGGGGSLPITGTAAGGIALLGLALIAGGTTLVVLRRRRKVTFIS